MVSKTVHAALTSARILIVDDDAGQRSLLDSFLRGQGFITTLASSGEQALEILRHETINLMISDVRMEGISGLETLRRARQEHAHLPVLLVTAYTDIRDAVGAMRDGAVNYLAKPIDLDELLSTVQQATGTHTPVGLRLAEDRPLPAEVIAISTAMQTVFRDAALIANSDSRVLITGESGVGKEILADVIHRWSPRAAGSLVKVNCAAIPETLLESELFGHEKGAFTGASRLQTGRFEEAHGGTIFLDEIGEMSSHLQAKLLRITQDGKFRRIGSNKEMHSDARILTATNRDLEAEVEGGRFREDLFYRLNVVEIHLPPLRERPEDILPLAAHFLAHFAKGKARFSPSVTERILQYSWPGNVRELRNAIERAALLARGEVILPEHLPARIGGENKEAKSVAMGDSASLAEMERQTIYQALCQHDFNRTETAKALGISRRAVTYKIQELRDLGFAIDPPRERPSAN